MHTLLIILVIAGGIWLAGTVAIFLWSNHGDWRHWHQNLLLAVVWPVLLAMACCGGIHII